MATWTAADLAALEAAIARGALTVKHGNKTVTYRSMADLVQARDLILRAAKSKHYPFGVASYSRFG